jgi:hypothetical protein
MGSTVASMPVMVTGGFHSVAGMVEALEGGDLDVVGLARPLIADPAAPRRLLADEIDKLMSPEVTHPDAGSLFRGVRRCNAQGLARGPSWPSSLRATPTTLGCSTDPLFRQVGLALDHD